ncbi:FbpB family small basic protein [Neobacillus dielmonensis]|nr:FbpB family small basic protein [Neobacillus dielmonensis]
MRKRILSFKELVVSNKQQIKEDLKTIEKIETRIENKLFEKVK